MANAEKRPERTNRFAYNAAGPSGSGNLEDARSRGTQILAAADQAIERALSGNSEAFLDASRQQGGQ